MRMAAGLADFAGAMVVVLMRAMIVGVVMRMVMMIMIVMHVQGMGMRGVRVCV